jgi:hypothetical protein
MSTTPASAHQADVGLSRQPARAHDHHILRNLAITIGASAVVLAGLAGLQYVRTLPATTSAPQATTVQAGALEAYAPGGSVYAQQVPTVAAAELTAYGPGGSVYAQQVPGAIESMTVTVPNAALRAMESGRVRAGWQRLRPAGADHAEADRDPGPGPSGPQGGSGLTDEQAGAGRTRARLNVGPGDRSHVPSRARRGLR